MALYFMVAHRICFCHQDLEVFASFEEYDEKLALEKAEGIWHIQLPLHAENYSLCRKLEVETTPKLVALAREMAKPSWGKG